MADFQKTTKSKTKYGPAVTVLLSLVLVLLLAVLWALFISGPARVHDVRQEEIIAKIESIVSGIRGVEENIFDYVTYQGYTDETLYWFDANGDIITSRAIETLDYVRAREIAMEDYGIETDSITLAFGYDSPCYEITGSGKLLLLDYDTFERVYQREDDQ